MRTFIEKDSSGIEYLVREGRAVVTATAPSPELDGVRVELLVENPPEIHPAIQIFLTPVVEPGSSVHDDAEMHAGSDGLVAYRIEWHRAPSVDPSLPITDVNEDQLVMNLSHLIAVSVDEPALTANIEQTWALPS